MAYPARVPINHLKLLKDSAGKSVPGTRNSSLAQEKHGVCEFLHMTAFNILISNFCNTENSVKWLTSQSFRKLTAYPKTLHTPRLCRKASHSWNYELSTCTAEG